MIYPRTDGIDTSENTQSMLVLSSQDLSRLRELIYQRAGIVLTSHKHDMVFNRLSGRLRMLNLSNFSQYIALLEQHPKSDEWQAFINALTTNLTSFFRESYHFPVLAEHARAQARGGEYKVWCTASSTGEEAYSIAITLDEALGPSPGGPRVWATDIDTNVLNKAIKGVYRANDIASLATGQKKRWFLRGTGERQDHVKVNKQLRSAIHFEQLNLLEPVWNVPGPFDAIFCRNVMIYFDAKTQQRLLERFAKMLRPSGIFFAGHSENFGHMTNRFRLRGQSVYNLVQG